MLYHNAFTIKQVHFNCNTYDHFISASPEQKSPPMLLENGKLYELVATLKDYSGSDYITVAVETPTGKFFAPIPSQQLFVGELSQKMQLTSQTLAGIMNMRNATCA